MGRRLAIVFVCLSYLTNSLLLADEVEATARLTRAGQTFTVIIQIRNCGSESEDFEIPAGMPFRTRSEKRAIVLAVESVALSIRPGSSVEVQVPVVPLAEQPPPEGPVDPHFDPSLTVPVRLVFTIHELSQQERVSSPTSQLCYWALQVQPIGRYTSEEVLSKAPVELRNDLEKSLATFAQRKFPGDGPNNNRQDLQPPLGPPELPPPRAEYIHALGRYRLRIPQDWLLTTGYRDSIPDPDYDTLQSPDGQYILAFSRLARVVGEPGQAMERFKQQILPDIQDREEIRILIRPIAGHKAIRIGYMSPKRQWGFWLIAVFHEEHRYVINAKFPRQAYTEELPPIIAEILETLTFLPKGMPKNE